MIDCLIDPNNPLFQENIEVSTGFRVRCIAATPKPQTVSYLALHQDYCSEWVGSYEELLKLPDEKTSGEIAVKRLLEGNKGHWGCLEHPQITFSCGYINHGSWQQARTHRIGVSFDIQSFRYTYEHLIKAANGEIPIENVVFFDSVGYTHDREGNKYTYTQHDKYADIAVSESLLQHYKRRVEDGMPPEKARRMLPFDYRQHGIFTANLRSLLHFLDLRAKANAQGEIIVFAGMLFNICKLWVPEIAAYYEKTRYKKALLSP